MTADDLIAMQTLSVRIPAQAALDPLKANSVSGCPSC
ncbi:hypothetical protein AB0G51_01290 [Streptomyces asoensis]